MHIRRQIEDNWEAVNNDLKTRTLDVEVRTAVREVLKHASTLKARIDGEKAQLSVVRRYVSEEARRLRDGERDKPVCGCELPRCDLKRGIVPGEVAREDSLTDGIAALQERHADPIVLHEAQAHWESLHGEVLSLLSDARTMITKEELIQVDHEDVNVVADDGTLLRDVQPWTDAQRGPARLDPAPDTGGD